MDFKQISQLLNEHHLSMNDIMKLSKTFANANLNDEKELKKMIKDICQLLNKEITKEQETKMIEMVKNKQFKM